MALSRRKDRRPTRGLLFLPGMPKRKGTDMILKAMKKINSALIWILIAEVAFGLIVFVADGFNLI